MIEVRKRDNETVGSLLFRFTRKTQQSGVLREARKRRFKARTVSRTSRRDSALHREGKRKEFFRARKLGIV